MQSDHLPWVAKNYLFAGGHEAAVNIGYYYTVFSTCKAQDVNPYDYALWYLRKINNTKITEIDTSHPVHTKI